MTELLIIRHGPTEWNKAKRLQGRSDISLSPEGQGEVKNWHIPDKFSSYNWVSSPLKRAQETATILGAVPQTEANLTEMSWGDWEGMIWRELLDEDNPELDANRARGLDFRPLNGESPREVQMRLRTWLTSLRDPTIAVTHKGVLQALYALATGWQMTDKSPDKIRDACAHHFAVENGNLEVIQMNISLKNNA